MEEQMRSYETVIVFSTRLTESQLEEQMEKVSQNLSSSSADNVVIDNWGRRDLGHEVKKQKQGVYVCFYYGATDFSAVETLTSMLRIEENVLLFQTHRITQTTRKFKGRRPKSESKPGDVKSQAA